MRNTTKRIAAAAVAVAVAATGVMSTAGPASAAPGETSLAEVLAADGNSFDGNWDDFDILDRAVSVVLDANPTSDVAVLADGSTPLTAFIPTDRAFRRLVYDLTGKRLGSERRVFNRIANTFDVGTIEDVLLYHVIPGATITREQAEASDGARLTTALGPKIRVVIRGHAIILRDADRDDRNPRVIRRLSDINEGNQQIAHGLNRMLRPVNL